MILQKMELPDDIIQSEICPWLTIQALINLKCCSTVLGRLITNKMATKAIMFQVIRRLSDVFGDLWSDFRNELARSRALISGSFLIQCILNETWSWPESDIDIYASHVDDKYYFESHLTDKSTNLDTWLLKNLIPTDHIGSTYTNSKHILGVRSFRFYKLVSGKRKFIDFYTYPIQSITLNFPTNKINDYIDSKFDFDICKNVFGVSENGVPYVQVCNLRQILERKIELTEKDVKRIDYKRRIKYENRGFMFVTQQ